jgi:hypothetical protein
VGRLARRGGSSPPDSRALAVGPVMSRLIELPELLALVEASWPEKYERGLILHIHRNALTLSDGSQVHLRVLVQRLPPSRDRMAAPSADPSDAPARSD